MFTCNCTMSVHIMIPYSLILVGIIFGGLLEKCRILQLVDINVAVMCTLASDFAHETLVGMYGQRILQGVLLQQRYKYEK